MGQPSGLPDLWANRHGARAGARPGPGRASRRSGCPGLVPGHTIPLLYAPSAWQATTITTEECLVMYAVLVTGGKQYRVAQGESLRVEKLEADAGSEIKFDNILMLGDSDGIKLGDALKGASVTAKVVGHGRADKIRIIKFRRRKHHMKR